MYNIGDMVRTRYGVGKIVKKEALPFTTGDTVYYAYKIKYSLFKRLWCFEDSIEERLSRWI